MLDRVMVIVSNIAIFREWNTKANVSGTTHSETVSWPYQLILEILFSWCRHRRAFVDKLFLYLPPIIYLLCQIMVATADAAHAPCTLHSHE